jgi:hypothetical protein
MNVQQAGAARQHLDAIHESQFNVMSQYQHFIHNSLPLI